MRRTWRFFLEWVAGGEDHIKNALKDDGEEWTTDFEPPWWEPEHLQQPDQQPLFRPSRSSASAVPELSPDIIMGPNPIYPPLLLPLSLLAPFSWCTVFEGSNFPTGYYCALCGRVNVQRFLRHRLCEGATCKSRTDQEGATGWAVDASSCSTFIRSATMYPDDRWDESTTELSVTPFGDEMRLYHYRLRDSDSGSLNLGMCSVRHVFNGNREWLQEEASALFEMLQRDVRFERSIGALAFTGPQIELDDPAPRDDWHTKWHKIVENSLRTYCHELGPLTVGAMRMSAWVSDGKVRIALPFSSLVPWGHHTWTVTEDTCSMHMQHDQTFCPRSKHLVLLCLGADIALVSVLSDPNTDEGITQQNEILCVTMVHGDIVVLSEGSFKVRVPCICHRVWPGTDLYLVFDDLHRDVYV